MGLLDLPHFCLFWAYGPACCYFLPNRPIGPYFFPFFLLGFYSPLFIPLLTNLFFHFSFAYYWAFLLLGFFFIKNEYQHVLCTQKLQALEKCYFTSLTVLTAYLLLWYSLKNKK